MPLLSFPVIVFYAVNMVVFSSLGTFILQRSLARRVYNISWIASSLITFAVYYFVIILDGMDFRPGNAGMLLESLFYSIIMEVLAFYKQTFFHKDARKRFITVAIMVVSAGIASCILSMLGDTDKPYNGIYDVFDAWRYALGDLLVASVLFTMMLVSGVKTYRRTSNDSVLARRRLLLFNTGCLSFTTLWILSFIGALTHDVLYGVFVGGVSMFANLTLVRVYLGWLKPGQSIQTTISQGTDFTSHDRTGTGSEDPSTSSACFDVLESLGSHLASLIQRPPHACMGLLLLLVEKQQGGDEQVRLDLGSLPRLFETTLLGELKRHDVTAPERVVDEMKAFLHVNFVTFSLALF